MTVISIEFDLEDICVHLCKEGVNSNTNQMEEISLTPKAISALDIKQLTFHYDFSAAEEGITERQVVCYLRELLLQANIKIPVAVTNAANIRRCDHEILYIEF